VRAAGQRRRRLSLVLVAVATVLAFLAIFAVWADQQLLDNDDWADTSSALLENDAIRGQVAGFLVDELYANVDVEGEISEALPPGAAAVAGPASGAISELADRGANRLLGRPRVQARWEEANRRAHAAFIKVIDGGGDVVSTGEGDVVLDLKELLAETQGRLGVGGRAAEELPADAAQITVLRSDQLALAQDIVRLIESLVALLVLLTVSFFALAVGLARGRRREALRACGAGLVVAGTGALIARSLAGDLVVDDVATTAAVHPAAEATWTIATSLLEEVAAATIGYGIVVLASAWLGGPSATAVATRRALAPYLREPRLAYGGLGVLVLLALASAPAPATRRVVPTLVMVGLLAVGFELLRRQTAREHRRV